MIIKDNNGKTQENKKKNIKGMRKQVELKENYGRGREKECDKTIRRGRKEDEEGGGRG